jgi:hypothetical protein
MFSCTREISKILENNIDKINIYENNIISNFFSINSDKNICRGIDDATNILHHILYILVKSFNITTINNRICNLISIKDQIIH